MKYLRYLNYYFPVYKGHRLNKKRGNLTQFIIENFKSSSVFLPTKEQYESFENLFIDSDEYIRQKYFPQRNQLWSSYNKGFADKNDILLDLSKKEKQFLEALKIFGLIYIRINNKLMTKI